MNKQANQSFNSGMYANAWETLKAYSVALKHVPVSARPSVMWIIDDLDFLARIESKLRSNGIDYFSLIQEPLDELEVTSPLMLLSSTFLSKQRCDYADELFAKVNDLPCLVVKSYRVFDSMNSPRWLKIDSMLNRLVKEEMVTFGDDMEIVEDYVLFNIIDDCYSYAETN